MRFGPQFSLPRFCKGSDQWRRFVSNFGDLGGQPALAAHHKAMNSVSSKDAAAYCSGAGRPEKYQPLRTGIRYNEVNGQPVRDSHLRTVALHVTQTHTGAHAGAEKIGNGNRGDDQNNGNDEQQFDEGKALLLVAHTRSPPKSVFLASAFEVRSVDLDWTSVCLGDGKRNGPEV